MKPNKKFVIDSSSIIHSEIRSNQMILNPMSDFVLTAYRDKKLIILWKLEELYCCIVMIYVLAMKSGSMPNITITNVEADVE